MSAFTATQKAKAAASPPSVQPEAGAAGTMAGHLPYARATARLDQVRSELRDAEAEANALYVELSRPAARAVADPIRAEAMRLLGEGDGGDGGAAAIAAKTARLEKLRARIAVLHVAQEEGGKIVRRHDRAAAGAVMAAAQPEYRRRLADHAHAVVAAARTSADVESLLAVVAEEVAETSSGLPNHAFQALGDLRDPYSGVSLFVRELVEVGVLSGDETWLADVIFYAKRPDGTTVCHAPPAVPDKAAADVVRHRAARTALRGAPPAVVEDGRTDAAWG